MQELKVVEEQFPVDAFQKLGYRCAVFGQKAYNGVAICARIPFQDVHKGFGDPDWDTQKRVIAVRLRAFDLVNVYAPHGDERGTDKFKYKLDFYRRLCEFLEAYSAPDRPLCVVGDMNVTRTDLDVYDPVALHDTLGTMPEERLAFEELLSWGLIDAFRLLYPERRQFTWWDYIGGRIWKDEGMRIDYILISEPLRPALKDVTVDLWPRRRRSPKPSDHAPVVAEFAVTG